MPVPALTLAAIRQPAFLWGVDGRVAEANDLAEALAGRPLAGCDAAGILATFANRRPDGTPFAPGTLPPTVALAGRELVDVPMVVTAADGRVVRLLVTASPLRDGDAVAGALVIWQDVTGEAEAARRLAAQSDALQADREEIATQNEELRCQGDELREQSEALRVSLERLGFGQRAARTGFWDWDMAREKLTWSPEFHDLFGLDPGAPASFETWLAVLHPDDREQAMATITRAMEERTPLENEYRAVLPGGRVRWIGAYGDSTYDAEGRPRRMAGICVDITARREAEAALRESERRYRELVESANSAIIRWRADGTVTFANDYALDLFGYAAHELVGRSVGLIVPARDSTGADLSGLVAEIVAHPGHRRTNVNENVRADGTRLWMLWTNSALLDEHGAVTEVLAVGTDITARRAAEDAVAALERESRTRLAELEAVYDAAPIGLAVLDPDLRYVRINRVLAALNRLPVEAHLGRTVRELMPAVADQVEEAARRVLETGETVQEVAISAAFPPDPTVYLLTQWAPVRDGQGGVTGVTVATVDITGLKRAEEALRESEAKYRYLVDLAPDGIVVHERGVIRYGNPAAARLLRTATPEALIGTNILDLVHPDDRTAGSSRVDAVQDRGRTTPLWEFRFLIDGEVIHADAVAGPVTWEGAPAVQVVLRDITARKRAEAALAESEARHRRLFETMLQGVVYQDADGTIVDMSPAAERILGKGPDEFLGGSSVGEEWHTLREDGTPFPGLEHPAMVALRTGEAVRDVVMGVYNPRDRDHRWISVTAVPLFHPGETVPYQVYTLFADITERRRMEEALRESEHHLARAQEIARVGSWSWEIGADELFWSDETYRLFGLEPGEIPPPGYADFLAFVHPDDRERVATAVQDALVSGACNVEFRFVRKGGDEGYAYSQAAVTFEDGSPVWMEGTVQDITERKRAEEELQETRDYLDSLIDYANAPIIVWDPAFRITRFNAAFEHLSGYAANQVIGRDLVMLFPEESREESLKKIERTVTEQWESIEIPILRPDGGIRIALWNSANIYDRSGTTLLATIAQGQDITERIEAEEALRAYAESLARSNEDLERFAYVSSHDLQEPLRSIVSFSQLLERRYRGQLGEDADEYIDFIVEGGQRMQTLIQDLLAYSRVNTTRQQFSPTDTADVLASVERGLDLQLREAGATLTHDPMPVVMADPIQLEQVLTNLVSNAIKFRKTDVPLRVNVSARRLDDFWEFSVSDNGIGIEKEYFDHIFVIFKRLHTKDAYPGTGIGLAIVKRIIDRHGGTIWVESTPGEGSTFVFTLPAAGETK